METKTSGEQTVPLIFDEPTAQQVCGLHGGELVVTGRAVDSFWFVDACHVQVPLVAVDTGPGAALVLEGCDDGHLGMITSLAPMPGGKTGETIDLNSRSIDVTIEKLIGERSYEAIDCNEIPVVVDELVSIEPPQKLEGRRRVSGPRFSGLPGFRTWSLRVRKTTILEDAVTARWIHHAPSLPDDRRSFRVGTTVEVILENGRKRTYTKSIDVALRS